MPYRDKKEHIKYLRYRWIKLKINAVAYKGGKCMQCGNSNYWNIHFHHRDPTQKDYEWRDLRKKSWATITEELDKCDALCSNCHGDVHHEMTSEITNELLEWGSNRNPSR